MSTKCRFLGTQLIEWLFVGGEAIESCWGVWCVVDGGQVLMGSPAVYALLY